MDTSLRLLLWSADESQGNASREIRKIFAKFDTDKSGFIEGEEFQKFMNDLCKYLHGDLKKQGHDYELKTIHDWAKQWVDPNSDGKITLQEMEANFKALLDAGE